MTSIVDNEAQIYARRAVMEIRLFPELDVMLKKATGYGPHVDMLQHFVFWFHPQHPKMRNRWTLWKTYVQWRDDCGLSRRQVEKGRRVLRELGLITEKKGQRGRIMTRVNWVGLAETLDLGVTLHTIGEQTDGFEDYDDDFSLHTNTGQAQFAHHGEQASLHTNTGQANSVDNAVENFQEKRFTSAGELCSPATTETKKAVNGAQPNGYKRHSQVRETPAQLSGEARNKVWAQILGFGDDTGLTEIADSYLEGKTGLDNVVATARACVGEAEPLETYKPWVERCLEDKRDMENGGANAR